MGTRRVGLGRLLLALDRAVVTLVGAPRGLDLPVGSVALIDRDDLRWGLPAGSGDADLVFLVGVTGDEAIDWLDRSPPDRVPVAIFAKEPSEALVTRAAAAGAAVIAVEPRARWERLYRLTTHVLAHHSDRQDPQADTGTDLFTLAQATADRTRGMVSIEDAHSHVLAYSASGDADELRRLSILGRAGPPEHLAWIAQWGIFDALRSDGEVVQVAERPELGLRPRLAIGVHRPTHHRHEPGFLGSIWVQQGAAPMADDAAEVLRGAAVLAARIMARLAVAPPGHAVSLQRLLGLSGDDIDVAAIAGELGVVADGRAAVVGFYGLDAHAPAHVIALSATAFQPDAQTTATGGRVYVLFPQTGAPSAVTSWVRGVVAVLHRELGVRLRAVIAAPVAGLIRAAQARADIDRVFDSADRRPSAIDEVTSPDNARTAVLLDEIVRRVDDRLVDPRARRLHTEHPLLAETLRIYLDSFGDIADAARQLHVHPNTVRYRIRRIEQLLSMPLSDPDTRVVLALSLRAISFAAPAQGWPTPRCREDT